MKNFLALLLLATAIEAANSTLSTIQSTIVSSLPCSSSSTGTVVLSPSKFVYSNASSFAPLSTTYAVVDVSSSATTESVVTAAAAASGSGSANDTSSARKTVYEYDTATSDSYVDVTKTVCDLASHCYTTTDLESKTTYTTSVDGILTVITTLVPVSASATATASSSGVENVTSSFFLTVPAVASSSTVSVPISTGTSEIVSTHTSLVTETPSSWSVATETEKATTVITITSCKDNQCTEVPKTTGLTLFTTTINNLETAYTTYCPISETESSSTGVPEAVESTSTEISVVSTPIASVTIPSDEESTSTVFATVTLAAASSTQNTLTTVDVITGNVATETPVSVAIQQQSTTSSAASSSTAISTFEGSAAYKVAGSTSIIALVGSLIFAFV